MNWREIVMTYGWIMLLSVSCVLAAFGLGRWNGGRALDAEWGAGYAEALADVAEGAAEYAERPGWECSGWRCRPAVAVVAEPDDDLMSYPLATLADDGDPLDGPDADLIHAADDDMEYFDGPPLEPLPAEPGMEWAEQLAAMPHIPSDPITVMKASDDEASVPRDRLRDSSAAPDVHVQRPLVPADPGDARRDLGGVRARPGTAERPDAGVHRGSPAVHNVPGADRGSRLTPAQRRRAVHKTRRQQVRAQVAAIALAVDVVPPDAADWWPRMCDQTRAAYDQIGRLAA
jgi:hypothetical protein